MSLLLHSTAIVAVALGPVYYPDVFKNEDAGSKNVDIEFVSDSQPLLVAKADVVESAPVPTAPEKIKWMKKSEEAAAKPATSLPEKKMAEAAPVVTNNPAPQEFIEETTTETAAIDPRYEALAEESPVEVDQAAEEEKLAEEKAKAAQAMLAAQEEEEKTRQEEERANQEQARAAELEEARKNLAAEKEKAANEIAEAKKRIEAAEAEKAQALAAAAASAKSEADAKAAAQAAANQAANQAAQGAGSAPKTVRVKQNFLELRQAAGNKPPSYTKDMRVRRLEGRGQLVYFVNKQGAVTDLRLSQTTGSPELDQAAVDAFRRYKFVPGQEGYTVHNFEFRLTGPAQSADGLLRATK